MIARGKISHSLVKEVVVIAESIYKKEDRISTTRHYISAEANQEAAAFRSAKKIELNIVGILIGCGAP
jgi:hypothetical protein